MKHSSKKNYMYTKTGPFRVFQEENFSKVQWRNSSLELLTRRALIASNVGHKGEKVICLAFEAQYFVIVSTFLASRLILFCTENVSAHPGGIIKRTFHRTKKRIILYEIPCCFLKLSQFPVKEKRIGYKGGRLSASASLLTSWDWLNLSSTTTLAIDAEFIRKFKTDPLKYQCAVLHSCLPKRLRETSDKK